jgi:hypothetical protein
MFELWRAAKTRRNLYRLEVPVTIEHEYQGAQRGHPSTYAFVRFECLPAAELSFSSVANWPESMSEASRNSLHRGIAEGIVDGLTGAIYPHRGVAIRLIDCRYDEVCSSVASFHHATVCAMQTLLKSAWTIVLQPHEEP